MIVVVVDDASGLGPLTWDGIATIIAAVLAAAVAIWGYGHQQRAVRRARRATMYSQALQAVEDYLEAPYIVLRRDGSASARMAITTRISEIQSQLSYFSAMLTTQAPDAIAAAYDTLVAQVRAEAGPELSAAWRTRPTRRDRDVPGGQRFNRSESDQARQHFLEAIAKHDPSR